MSWKQTYLLVVVIFAFTALVTSYPVGDNGIFIKDTQTSDSGNSEISVNSEDNHALYLCIFPSSRLTFFCIVDYKKFTFVNKSDYFPAEIISRGYRASKYIYRYLSKLHEYQTLFYRLAYKNLVVVPCGDQRGPVSEYESIDRLEFHLTVSGGYNER